VRRSTSSSLTRGLDSNYGDSVPVQRKTSLTFEERGTDSKDVSSVEKTRTKALAVAGDGDPLFDPKIQSLSLGVGAPSQNPQKILGGQRLPPFLEWIKAYNMPEKNCLGFFEVKSPSQLPEKFTLSISPVTILHGSRYVVSEGSRRLTLEMLQGKQMREIGYVDVSCDDMTSAAQCWQLRKWKVPYKIHDMTTWFVMLGAIFELLRQTHLKVLVVTRGVSSLHDASRHLLTLENCCRSKCDFPLGDYRPIWKDFTKLTSVYAAGRSIWTIPAQPDDIYKILLGCPGEKLIVFAHHK